MTLEYVRRFELAGAEVAIIAEPREVIVDCRGSLISDDDLACLADERDLTTLWLHGCHITNVGVLRLASNQRLRWLDVGETGVTGDGLCIIPNLPVLRGVNLCNLQDVRRGLPHLMGHPTLEALILSHTDVIFSDIKAILAKSNRVTDFELYGTSFTGFDVLGLEDLDVEPCRFVHFHYGEDEHECIVMAKEVTTDL